MNASTSSSPTRRHRRTARPARVEALESRTLLSAWTTVNTLQAAAGQRTGIWGMGADNAGNVYAAGRAIDSSGLWHGIIREQSTVNGVTSWSTVEDVPNARFYAVTTDSAGDVFACGHYVNVSSPSWIVSERQVGKTSFTLVNDSPTGWTTPVALGIAVDSSGNVFVVGQATVQFKQGHSYFVRNDWLVRTDASTAVAKLFRHAHIALPPRARQTAPPKPAPAAPSAKKRRGRPRRSATSSRISPQTA